MKENKDFSIKGHMQPKIKFLSFERESSYEYFGEVL